MAVSTQIDGSDKSDLSYGLADLPVSSLLTSNSEYCVRHNLLQINQNVQRALLFE
jgi:hypothetical protein